MSDSAHPLPHLSRAPIVEALIDFRVRLPADFEVTRFKDVHAQFEAAYPKIEERKFNEHKFEHAPDKEPSHTIADRGIHGYLFHSADGTQIVQFRRDGFTFNRLKPYTSWEQVFAEATWFWKLYVQTCQPIDISRIAVRYINRLMLPGPDLEFSDYLAAPPPTPGGPTSSLADIRPEAAAATSFIGGFVSRVTINDLDAGITAAVVQALEPPADDRYIPVLLDIDVFQKDMLELSPDAVLIRFDKLREAKNCAFFGSITNKTLEMLK